MRPLYHWNLPLGQSRIKSNNKLQRHGIQEYLSWLKKLPQ